MDRDQLPSKPVITSLVSANAQIATWLKANDRRFVHDGDGAKWQLEIRVNQKPDPHSMHGGVWEIKLCLAATLTAAELVTTQTLNPAEDARLLELIGDQSISFSLKPVIYHSADEDEAKVWLADAVQNLHQKLTSRSLRPVKRQLIGRWIDERCHFASYPHRC